VVSFSDLTPKSTTGNVPLIGDLIPSRWAYEALAVTSYTDNAYEAPMFQLDKEKYENEFYNMGFVYELQSQLETMKSKKQRGEETKTDHLNVIRTNLPRLTAYTGMKPYTGDESYQSLYDYLKEAEQLLTKEGMTLTMRADKQMGKRIREEGKEAVLDLKRQHFNLKLQDCVMGADQPKMLEVIDDVIVARTGTIFLTPQSTIGRAPFYSSEKILGSWHVKTLWFNISMMILMCIITALLLFNDCPGRFIRKS